MLPVFPLDPADGLLTAALFAPVLPADFLVTSVLWVAEVLWFAEVL